MLNLFLAFDHLYLKHAVLLAKTVSENYPDDIHVWFTTRGEQDQQQLLDQMRRLGSQCTFLPFNPPDHLRPQHPHISIECFARIYVIELVEADEVLYLDPDILCVNPLPVVMPFPTSRAVSGVSKRPLSPDASDANEFNSGVLFINRKRWQDQEISRRAMEVLNQSDPTTRMGDQAALNLAIGDDWEKLDADWNMQYNQIQGRPQAELQTFLERAKFLHYTGAIKPWHFNSNTDPITKQYHQVLKNHPMKPFSFGRYIWEDNVTKLARKLRGGA